MWTLLQMKYVSQRFVNIGTWHNIRTYRWTVHHFKHSVTSFMMDKSVGSNCSPVKYAAYCLNNELYIRFRVSIYAAVPSVFREDIDAWTKRLSSPERQFWFHFPDRTHLHFDGSMQEWRNAIANGLVLRFSCVNPSICSKGRNLPPVVIGSWNGLAPHRWKATTWSNGDLVFWA